MNFIVFYHDYSGDVADRFVSVFRNDAPAWTAEQYQLSQRRDYKSRDAAMRDVEHFLAGGEI